MNFLNEFSPSDSDRHSASETPLAAASEFYYDLKPSWVAQQQESVLTPDSAHPPPLRTPDGGDTVFGHNSQSSIAMGPGYTHSPSHSRRNPLSPCANCKNIWQPSMDMFRFPCKLLNRDLPPCLWYTRSTPLLVLLGLVTLLFKTVRAPGGAALMTRQSAKYEWPCQCQCLAPDGRSPPATCSTVPDTLSRKRAVVSISNATIFGDFDRRIFTDARM